MKSQFASQETELTSEELSSAQGGTSFVMPPIGAPRPPSPAQTPDGFFPMPPNRDLLNELYRLLEEKKRQAAAAGG